ncbi:MAG: 4Fe-4S binding protein [Rhodocyclaceae bacterium]
MASKLSPQTLRRLSQAVSFALFLMAPAFDWLRFDLVQGHAYFLGWEWHLGFDEYFAKRISLHEVAANIFLKLFLPVFAAGMLLLAIAWRWGRIYCGWFCPHFGVVELLNGMVARASGKASLWDARPLPGVTPQPRGWLPIVIVALATAFAWSVAIVTYVIPPREVYVGLMTLTLAPTPTAAIAALTIALFLEFLFARHLFCRYGCSVGLFQSLAWLMNRDALVIGFDRGKAARCAACYGAMGPGDAASETICPMRLQPRMSKHKMSACTQCGLCIEGCATVQAEPLLRWVKDETARGSKARQALFVPPMIKRGS